MDPATPLQLTQGNVSPETHVITEPVDKSIGVSIIHKPTQSGDSGTGEQGRIGGLSANQTRVGAPTTEIINAGGIAIAWDLIEDESRRVGIVAAALRYKVKAPTIRAREKSHKWRGIPDGRSLTKTVEGSGIEPGATPGDFTARIPTHRERVFKIATDSIKKKKTIPIKSAKDFDIVDRVARRAAGIDDTESSNTNVLIRINEAIEDHDAPEPIEAEVVRHDPLLPDANASSDSLGKVEQGSTGAA